jgi:integrase
LTRQKSANGRSSIYLGGDGKWHGRVTMGVRDDGKPDRRHCEGKTQSEVTAKVRAFEKERDQGRVRKPGQRWKVGTWLEHWVNNIAAPPTVSENTQAGYEVDVRRHLVPGVGAHWLDKLDAEHLEKLYTKLLESGLSAGTVNHIHRTIRASLNEAVRRGHIGSNPALIAKPPPSAEEEEVEPYEVEEIRKLLEVAARRRNSARWAAALALGLRQGEALGLQWPDIDLDSGTMRVRRGRLRPKYEHGCGDTCGRKPGYCPQRRNVRQATRRVKSKAGKRTIGLPAQLVTLLQEHRTQQDAEQAAARQLWQHEGWVFAGPTGGALNPNTDYHEWKSLLEEAGVRESRLHDARHTAATVLLLLEVPLRTVMSIMGWSSVDMVARYQHITDAIRQKVAGQVDEVIWQTTSSPASADVVTVRREALAVILPIADIGLAHSDVETLTDLEDAIAHLRAALADESGPGAVPKNS